MTKWRTRVSEAKSFTRAILEEGYEKWLACQKTEVRVAHELMGEDGFQDWLKQELAGGFRSVWDDPVLRQWPAPTLEKFQRDVFEWAHKQVGRA